LAEDIEIPHSTETARDFLVALNKNYSWGKISVILGIPTGTLWHIANGGSIPSKWKPRLGVYYGRDLYSMPVRELRWAVKNRR